MVEHYFDYDEISGQDLINKRKRVIAVNAALEIIKHAVGPTGGSAHSRVDQDLESVTEKLDALVNAIQATLDK